MKDRKEYDTLYNHTHKAENKAWREANKDVLVGKQKGYAALHRVELAAYQKDYHAKSKAKKQAYDRRRWLRDKKKMMSRAVAWKKAHPEAVSKSGSKRYIKNKAHILAVNKAWKQANPHKINAMAAKRRAALLNAVPPWLTPRQQAEITKFYSRAKALSRSTGVEHHVDHKYPLQGKTVSGLHVPWNLQILTADQNYRKSNKLIAA